MKLIILYISFFVIACTSNDKKAPNSSKVEEKVAEKVAEKVSVISIDTVNLVKVIDEKSIAIDDNLNSLRNVDKKMQGQSAEGGNISGYYNENDLRKIIVTFYGEIGKAQVEYYFDKEELFFMRRTDFYYDKPIYMDGSKIKSKQENKFYFYNEELIQWKNEEGVLVNPQSNEFTEENKYILEDVANALKVLNVD